MNVGIIGTGRIGSTFIEGLCLSGCSDINVLAYNRTRPKIIALKAQWPGVEVLDTVENLIQRSDIVVLAVPFSWIQQMRPTVFASFETKQPLTIALCAYVPIRLLEATIPCKTAKAFPNINWAIGCGVTILSFGEGFRENERAIVIDLLSRVGIVREVPEGQFRPLSNLMSCGPALWIKIIDLFIRANLSKYEFDSMLAYELANRTISGTFRLMEEKGFSTEEVINLVSSPGGVTEVALKCFEQSLPVVFVEAVEQIALRDKERIEKLSG